MQKRAVNEVINKITEDFQKIVAVTKSKICQKHFTKLQKMKNTQLIKIEKRPGRTYFFECKDFAHNFRPQKVKMTNKVLRKKSNCVVCWSNLKQTQQ